MQRVATSNQANQLVHYMLKNEAKVAAAQIQSASGQTSTSYAGIAGDSARLVNLQSVYQRSERYVDEGEVVNGRVQAMYDAVNGMVDLSSRLSSLIASVQGTASTAAAGVKQEAAGLMQEFAALLNTRQDGRYLFAGGRTDQPAVFIDAGTYPAATVPTTADTSYYRGDGAGAYFQADDDLVVDYGVRADNPAVEKALRAFNLIATMSTDPVDTAVFDEASNLADEGTDGLTIVQSTLGTTSATLERTIDRHLDRQLILQTQVDDISKVDVAAAATRLSQLQASLTATMSLMTILEETNLTKFL